ncbi:MAG: hypothetical protein ACLVKR_04945, partial [Lachnospiraceae bacterium]
NNRTHGDNHKRRSREIFLPFLIMHFWNALFLLLDIGRAYQQFRDAFIKESHTKYREVKSYY